MKDQGSRIKAFLWLVPMLLVSSLIGLSACGGGGGNSNSAPALGLVSGPYTGGHGTCWDYASGNCYEAISATMTIDTTNTTWSLSTPQGSYSGTYTFNGSYLFLGSNQTITFNNGSTPYLTASNIIFYLGALGFPETYSLDLWYSGTSTALTSTTTTNNADLAETLTSKEFGTFSPSLNLDCKDSSSFDIPMEVNSTSYNFPCSQNITKNGNNQYSYGNDNLITCAQGVFSCIPSKYQFLLNSLGAIPTSAIVFYASTKNNLSSSIDVGYFLPSKDNNIVLSFKIQKYYIMKKGGENCTPINYGLDGNGYIVQSREATTGTFLILNEINPSTSTKVQISCQGQTINITTPTTSEVFYYQ